MTLSARLRTATPEDDPPQRRQTMAEQMMERLSDAVYNTTAPWMNCLSEDQSQEVVRAVLKELREPSPEMVDKGAREIAVRCHGMGQARTIMVYTGHGMRLSLERKAEAAIIGALDSILEEK